MRSRLVRTLVVCAASAAILLGTYAVLAALALSTTTPVTQNFDGIGTAAAATLPADFRVDRTTTQVRTVGTYAAAATATTLAGGANLSATAGNGIYNFGAGTTTTGPDRAIGFLASGTATASGNLYAQFVNSTGGDLTGLQVKYNVEKYRGGSNANGYRIQLFYSTDGAAWTSAGAAFTTGFPADASNAGFATAPGAAVAVDQPLNVPIPNGASFYLAWNYSVATGTTSTNAQALAVDDISILGLGGGGGGPTNPSGTMTANAANYGPGNPITLTVNVTPGTNPASTGISVTGNLGAIDLGTPAFVDQGGNVFTFTGTIPGTVTGGLKSLTATITDGNSPPRTGTTSPVTQVTIQLPTPPTGTGSANPPSVAPGAATLLTVTVTPGTNPASTGITVTGDLSEIGIAGLQMFSGAGNTFTYTATVAPGTAEGSKTFPIAIADAQGRTSGFNLTLTVATPVATNVIINEIDADTPGSDTAEFVELYDGGAGHTSLNGLVVVFYAGEDHKSYASFDLDGYTTNASGYFTLGNPGVPGVDLVFDPGLFGLLQNGADAVALYAGNATSFPAGTSVTTAGLQDAIVYGTDDAVDNTLLGLLNAGQLQVNENATGNQTTQSSQRCPNGAGGARNTSSYYPGTPTPGSASVCPAPRPPSAIVISQLYGGGGNAGATYHNDYVELFNRSAATVDLTGWSLQYASAAGSGWDSNKQPLAGSIASGKYYLVALASGGAVGAPLPPANISGEINMAAGSGKIALVDTFDGLLGGCPLFDPHLMDFVGYGSGADCGEGATKAPTGTNTTALFRAGAGSTDTDHNGPDFAAGIPLPRQTEPIVEFGPLVLSTDPRRNGTDAPRDATIQVTFTEPVDVDSGWFDITCASSGQHDSATFAGTGKDRYITPNVNFFPGEQCTVTLFKNQVHDQDSDDSGPNTDTLPANFVWSFTVASGTPPPFAPSVHLTMGNPSGAVASILQPNNYLMEKPEFAMSYNRDLGRPNWVSWHLSTDWTGTLLRVDTFRPDPAVPPDWYRVQSFDFSGSGFDRGHMTPNADRDKETSIPINQATFLMSNMVAQAPNNNQGPWAAFEGYLRTLTEPTTPTDPGREIYIVAGPAGTGGIGSNLPATVTNTLANGHVTVPAFTWKVALVLSKDAGDDTSQVTCSTRTIAVIMPNQQGLSSDWQDFLTTVDAVETLTGYDFFSVLPEPLQQCVEAGTNGVNPPLVKGDQTITFAALAPHTFGDAPFTVSATGGNSGNAVTFTASGACTSGGFSGATITIDAPGSCMVIAAQAGNTYYNAAADVSRSVVVAKATAALSALSSPSIEAGTASTLIGGIVTGVNGIVPTGSVTFTVDGVPVSAAIGVTGQFSASVATAALSPALSPYPIAFSYPGDGNFESAGGNATLTVADTTAPIITLVGPTTLTIEGGTTFTDPGATATDSFGGNLTAAIQATGIVNTAVVGSYTRTYTVSDGYNPATTTRTVKVVDTIPPILTLTGGSIVTTALGSPWIDPGATAADSRAGDLTSQITVSGTVNTAAPGTYPVTYGVSDGVNTTTAVRTVKVVDLTAPSITHLSATPNTLFFPTNTLWPVLIAYNASDASGTPACSLGVTSNDLDDTENRERGHGNRDIDWIVVGPHLVLLRAERAPKKGPQLLYTITVTCADTSGNTSTAQVIVPVRKR